MKFQLPYINIWSPGYIEQSRKCDRCSCSPDDLHGVYIGHCCRRHDQRYAWIWRQRGWWKRVRLKWLADKELGDGIAESFRRAGIQPRLVPWAYKRSVIMFNFPFRLLRAAWKAITFQC